MSTAHPLTFGGEFRRLRSDLQKMNDDTRKRYIESAGQDARYCHDHKNIQIVEERIIEAVGSLPARDLFKSMTIHHSALHHTFSHHWDKLQAMTSRWQIWRSAWREHAEQHGDLINDREWEQDGKILKKLCEAFERSEPKGFEKRQDWIDNYAPESGVTEGVQNLRLDADSKASDMLIPSNTAVVPDTLRMTFGYAYRQLLASIDALISLIRNDHGDLFVRGKRPWDFRIKQLEVIQNVKSFQAMRFHEHSLFALMVDVGTKGLTGFASFFEAWHGLLEVCSRWNAKLIGVLICINHCKGKNWRMIDERERYYFNLLSWQCDRETLNGIAWVFKESEPRGLKGHPGWTEDTCYGSCLTTTRAPCIPFSEQTGAPSPRKTSQEAHTYGYGEPTDTTFGGAWRNLVHAVKELEALNDAAGFAYYGMQSPGYWQRIFEFEQRITPRVQTLPKHPLFNSMLIGPGEDPASRDPTSRERFRRQWNALEMLCEGWEYWKGMFLKSISWDDMLLKTGDWDEKYEIAVHWDRIMHVLGPLELADAWPEGHKEKPEWTEDSRRVAELMEQK